MISAFAQRASWRLSQRVLYQPALKRFSSDLPYHVVVGFPALSPTMESGVLSEWYVKEGDSFAAGDALAKIETDKAAIDFEAQDDGVVAVILKEAGDDETAVNTPIMVTVEEPEDVAAFANFVPPVVEEAPSVTVETPVAEKVAASPPPPPPSPPTPTPPPAVQTVEAVVPPEAPAPAAVSEGVIWSPPVSSSPLESLLRKAQTSYTDLYGTTGQRVSN